MPPIESGPIDLESAGRIFAGGGAMGDLMRCLDWSVTPLGPVETWPQSLKTTVSTCLYSRFAIVVWWGPEMVTLYNDAYSRILGVKHPAALGMPARDLWPEIWHIVGPMLRGVMERSEATWSDNLLLELERNGYPEECYFTFSYSPIRDESGGVGGIFTPVQETTDQVIGERRLRTLRDLAEAARAANAQSSAEVCRLACLTLERNLYDIPFAAFYLLSESGEARLAAGCGIHSANDLLPQLARRGETWAFAHAFDCTGPAAIELPPDLKNVPCGAWPLPPREALVFPISPAGQNIGFAILAISPRKRLDEEYLGFLSLVGSHVTTGIVEARTLEEERKRAEALAEIDRAKTAFFSNVSHEFRTPLTLMLGPLEELLLRDGMSPADLDLLSVTHRNALRLQKLVNTLLDFSRIEAGRVQANYRATDLAVFTAELASAFRAAVENAGLELIVDCPPLADAVYVDCDMWEKIVLNLLSNALKYTFHGRIAVRIARQRSHDRMAVLTVEDTGTGIPAPELPHLFERFHRVEGARGRTQEGTGIGLALIAELVKLHGGTVEVSSVVGQGSSFTVSIPFGAAHLPKERVSGAGSLHSTALHAESYVEESARWLPPATTTRAASVESTRAGRVLIVDDNRDMREYLGRLLESDYDVESAANGEEALACVKNRAPDLLLSDVMMPVLDGFGLLRALRDNPETRTLPVILLSARAGEEARVEGLDAGASDYLVKPFTARELLARIGAQLDMARIRRQAAAREAELRAEAEAARDEVSGILESITDAFVVFDRDWRFSYINAEAERLLGLPRDQLLGVDHWTLFDKTLGTIVEHEYRRAVRDQVAIEFEYYYAPWDKWFVIRGYPTREGGLSNYFRDITAQKHAEAALREQGALREADRNKWRELFFQVPAAVAILRGPDHVFESFNEEYQRLVDRTSEQLFGKPVREVFPEVVPQGYVQLLDSVYRNGIPYSARESLLQLDATEDGVPREMYLNFVYNAIRDDRGEITGVFVHAVNVTDLVNARKKIEESEERFRQLAESMPQVVWSTDAAGVLDYVNSRWTELTGCDLPATLGNTFREKMLPEDLQALDFAFAESLRTGKAYSVECRFPRVADGSLRWHLVSAVPIRNHRGEVVKWIGTSTDIDAQKRANEDLRRANDDLEQFSYSASHDLQEPLRTLKIYSELLAARYTEKLDGQALQMLGYLRAGASRMETLVRDLLAYTQVKNLEGREETEASEAIASALANLENAIHAASAQIIYGVLPPVRIHRIHLQQLFQNLIGNAMKYRSSRPPLVRVDAIKKDQHWLFSVSDNGIGIDPEHVERIFGLFKRLHTGDEYSGTGIGLAICKRIVEQYGGRIWVESVPGEGSTFYFTIPL